MVRKRDTIRERCECDECSETVNIDGSHGVYRSRNEHHAHQVILERQRQKLDKVGSEVIALSLDDDSPCATEASHPFHARRKLFTSTSLSDPPLDRIFKAAQDLLGGGSSTAQIPHDASGNGTTEGCLSNEGDDVVMSDTYSELIMIENKAREMLGERYSVYSTPKDLPVGTDQSTRGSVDGTIMRTPIGFDCSMLSSLIHCSVYPDVIFLVRLSIRLAGRQRQ